MKQSLFRAVPPGAHVPVPQVAREPKPTITDDYEAADRYFTLSNDATETLVYQTQRRWRAVDVSVVLPFVTTNPIGTPGDAGTIRVYGIFKGQRTLVARGRVTMEKDGSNTGLVQGPVWVAGARVDCERYEVTWQAQFVPTNPIPPGDLQHQARVVVCASDQAVDVPPNLGCQAWNWTGVGPNRLLTTATQQMASTHVAGPVQIVGLLAVNTQATARVLTIGPGSPVFWAAWQVPPGGSVYFNGETGDLLPYIPPLLPSQATINILTSAFAAGADGDMHYQVWWR